MEVRIQWLVLCHFLQVQANVGDGTDDLLTDTDFVGRKWAIDVTNGIGHAMLVALMILAPAYRVQ